MPNWSEVVSGSADEVKERERRAARVANLVTPYLRRANDKLRQDGVEIAQALKAQRIPTTEQIGRRRAHGWWIQLNGGGEDSETLILAKDGRWFGSIDSRPFELTLNPHDLDFWRNLADDGDHLRPGWSVRVSSRWSIDREAVRLDRGHLTLDEGIAHGVRTIVERLSRSR